MAQAVLYVELVPTTVGIKRNIEKELDGAFSTAERKGTSLFSKIGSLAKGAALAAGAAAATLTGIALKGGFERMLKIEDAEAKLTGLGHSAETITTIMDSALASVKGTAFGLDDAATLAATAVAAGIKPGIQLEKYLRLTADAATIAGGSLSDLGSVMNNVTTIGAAYNDSLQVLAQKGLPIYQWLADELGITTAAVKDLASEGKISAETFRAAIEKNISGAALEAGATTRGAFANMMAALSRVGVALLAGVFPYVQPALLAATGFLDSLTDKIAPFMDTVAEVMAPIGAVIADVFSGALDVLGPLWGDIGQAAMPVLAALGEAFGTLWSAIEPLLPQLLDMFTQFSPLLLILETLGPVIGELAGELAVLLGGAISFAMPILLDLVEVLGGALVAALGEAISFLRDMAAWMTANEEWVGLIAFSLGGLVAGIYLVVGAIKVWQALTIAFTAVQAILNAVLTANPVGIIIVAIGALVGAIIWLATQTTVFQDIWSALSTAFIWVWENGIKPVVDGIAAAFTWLYETILKPVFDAIAAVVSWWWTSILEPIFKLVMIGVGLMAMAFQFAYETFIKPAIDAIAAAVSWVYESIILPIVGFISSIITAMGVVFAWLYAAAIKPALDGIGAVFSWVWDSVIKPIANFISTAVNLIGSVIGSVFGIVGNVIKGAFDGVVGFVKGIFNTIIDLVNGVIGGINSVADVVGGAIGMDLTLSKLPRLANGALVEASFGGSAAIIGEGRYDEVVMPLGGPQLERIRQALTDDRGSAGDRGNVYIDKIVAPDQDPRISGRIMGREFVRQIAG